MEKNNPQALIQEIRDLTSKLNNISESVKTMREQFHGPHAAEQRFYTFLNGLIDKLLVHQLSYRTKEKQ